MLGIKPLTREELLEMLERPEHAELKARFEEMGENYKEAILEILIAIYQRFDSIEDFHRDLELYEMKKTVSA